MTAINRLTSKEKPTSSDLAPIWDSQAGRTRNTPYSGVADFVGDSVNPITDVSSSPENITFNYYNGDEKVISKSSTPAFDDVAAMTAYTGGIFPGDLLQTKVNNTTSNAGGADYLVKTNAQAVTDGDVIDGDVNHQLQGSLVAILIFDSELDVYKAGFLESPADSTRQFNNAVNRVSPGGCISGSGKFRILDAVIEENPITLKGNGQRGLIFEPSGGASFTLKLLNNKRGSSGLPQFWQEDQANGLTLKSIIFSGRQRSINTRGLVFEGINDDVLLRDLHIYQYKGVGLDLGDPDDATFTSDQGVRETLMDNVEVKNCGTAILPAMRIGRPPNATGDNHNNILMSSLSVVYPYGVGLQVKDNRGDFSGRIRKIKVDNSFFHGTRQLPTLDNNGEDPHSASPIVEVGGGSGFVDISLSDTSLIEQELGLPCMDVLSKAAVSLSGTIPAGGTGFVGARFTDARQSYVGEVSTDDNAALNNFIDVVSMNGLSKLSLGNIKSLDSGASPDRTVTNSTNLSLIDDQTAAFITFEKQQESSASDVLLGTPLRSIERDSYLTSVRLLVNDAVTASDSNYAIIVYRIFNASGSLVEAVTETTQTTGTGNIAAKTFVTLPLPTTTKTIRAGSSLQVSISKVGAGVVLPALSVSVKLSSSVKL